MIPGCMRIAYFARPYRTDDTRGGNIHIGQFLDHATTAGHEVWVSSDDDHPETRTLPRRRLGRLRALAGMDVIFMRMEWRPHPRARLCVAPYRRLLPRPVAVRIVTTMEARLAATNRRFRYTKPLADLRAAARGAWNDGIDLLLWGHFHTTWSYHRDDRSAVILPAWLDTRSGALIGDHEPPVMVEKNLTPTGPILRMGG